MKRKFVLISDDSDGTMFCLGMYDKFETALGAAMLEVYEDKDGCKEGDTFEFSDLQDMEGESGVLIHTIKKYVSWEKPFWRNYIILFYDEEGKNNE